MSACLADRNIPHVVLERHRTAERWRSERWDSLRLLTPNWMNRLPGWSYNGPDPHGFMQAAEVACMLVAYAHHVAVPVISGANVDSVSRAADGYKVQSSAGTWHAPVVIIATGQCDVPYLPAMARCLSSNVAQIHAAQYRYPTSLLDGRVLVVGASSSGLQIAHEVNAAGLGVTVAAGRHIRMPRRYLGRDIMWWLERAGVLDDRASDIRDLDLARRQPSLQLSSHADQHELDLATLQRGGVRLAGRLVALEGSVARFGSDLSETVAASEAKLNALLSRFDKHAAIAGGGRRPPDIDFSQLPDEVDLLSDGIRTIIWATGYRRNYQWLHVPVLNSWGEIIHEGGVTPAGGLYVIGLNLLRRRNSSFIGGVGRDAQELAVHIAQHLSMRVSRNDQPPSSDGRGRFEPQSAVSA